MAAIGQKKVVVIGGGYGGVEAAKSMDKAFDVALITGRESFLHVVGGLRASVVPGYHQRLLIPYEKTLKRGKVFCCPATKIDPVTSTVTVSSGEVVPYDFLILATGMLHPKTVGVANGKATGSELAAVFDQARTKVSAAQRILVVGGGPIGIEMAGEIAEVFPEKEVTLVTSKELMLSPHVQYPEKLRTKLRTKLASVGVTVHTDVGRVSVDLSAVDECGFITETKNYKWMGGEIEADLCIVATGAIQAPPLYADSGLKSWMNDRGELKVERTLEVKGAGGNVFAIGDSVDLPVPKIAYLAGIMGHSISKNIAAKVAGKPLKDIAPVPEPVTLVPVGSNGGVSSMPMGFVFGDFLTRTVKSKDLFVGKYWGLMGAGNPPAV